MKADAIYKYRLVGKMEGSRGFLKKILQSVAIFKNSPIFVKRRKKITDCNDHQTPFAQLLYEKKGTDHPCISAVASTGRSCFIFSFLSFPVQL
jgi:hypothetical protein